MKINRSASVSLVFLVYFNWALGQNFFINYITKYYVIHYGYLNVNCKYYTNTFKSLLYSNEYSISYGNL